MRTPADILAWRRLDRWAARYPDRIRTWRVRMQTQGRQDRKGVDLRRWWVVLRELVPVYGLSGAPARYTSQEWRATALSFPFALRQALEKSRTLKRNHERDHVRPEGE